MINLILICSLIGFFLTIYLTIITINYNKRLGLQVKDMNKYDKPLIPTSGGLAVFSGFFLAVMFFIFINTFYYKDVNQANFLFAGLLSILIITIVGFLDDAVIKDNQETTTGLKQWQKPLLVLPAAIPLMVVNAGVSKMYLPILGSINLGILYPLLLVPIAVVGASNMVNMLAGFNGLEAGMGFVYMLMLGFYAYVFGNPLAGVIALILAGCLLGFYFFNKYPAKILPGDSLTYMLGGSLAVVAILGNIERAALLVSVPFFIEFFLKLRSNFKSQSYGYYKDGKIISFYKKIYSIPHIFTRTGKYNERQITFFVIIIMIIFSSLIWFI